MTATGTPPTGLVPVHVGHPPPVPLESAPTAEAPRKAPLGRIGGRLSRRCPREKLRSLTREVMKLPPAEGIPEWETPESTSKWVHDGRVESDRARNV
jgi:hypothetical protein